MLRPLEEFWSTTCTVKILNLYCSNIELVLFKYWTLFSCPSDSVTSMACVSLKGEHWTTVPPLCPTRLARHCRNLCVECNERCTLHSNIWGSMAACRKYSVPLVSCIMCGVHCNTPHLPLLVLTPRTMAFMFHKGEPWTTHHPRLENLLKVSTVQPKPKPKPKPSSLQWF